MNDEIPPGGDKRPDLGAVPAAAAPQWLNPASLPGAPPSLSDTGAPRVSPVTAALSAAAASPAPAPAHGAPPVPRDGGYAHSQGFDRHYVPPATHGPPPDASPPAGYAQTPPPGLQPAPGYPPYGVPGVYAPPPVHLKPPERLSYDGKLGELYLVYLRSLLLTLLTLGLYRFWGRTRVRRYLWSHVSAFGDRFEYRGRGIELFLGFIVGLGFVMMLVGTIAGLLWLTLRDTLPPEISALDITAWLLLLAGYPLLAVGRYAGLRYRLTRTRWRGVRAGLDGSAWKFGGMAVGLGLANGMCGSLLSPVVDVTLARYRLSNLTFGTVRFGFAGQASDIYGRFIGFYFLNIVAWIVLAVIVGVAIGGLSSLIDRLGGWAEIADKIAHPTPMVLLVIFLAVLALYTLIGLLILPLRCWYQAYLLRYIVSRTWFGPMQFVTGVTTGQMWGFIVLNWIILVFTLGFGWPWVLHRTARLVAEQLWIYGDVDANAVAQALGHGPSVGEGLLDLFDTGIV